MLKEKLYSRISLLRLDKPIGILLLLWPTLLALWISGKGNPPSSILFIFIAGVIIMRSAGCVINDLADRHFDKLVSRTAKRSLTTGKITVLEAYGWFFSLLIAALALALQLNTFTLLLSIVALMLAVIYPYMKRYTHWPQVVLGAAFGWSIPMAYAAVKAPLGLDMVLLFMATMCWIVVYDTQYAMVDKADDIKIGIKSTAILFGQYDRMIIGLFQIAALALFLWLGVFLQVGVFYYGGVLVAAILAAYQQYLIKDRIPKECFKAFLNNNYFGAVLFIGLILDYANY